MRSKKQARVYARIGSATLGPAPTLRRYKREPAPSARHTTSHSQRSNFSSRTGELGHLDGTPAEGPNQNSDHSDETWIMASVETFDERRS